MEKLVEIVLSLLPMTVVIVVGFSVLGFLNRRLVRKSIELAGEGTFRRQMVLTFLALFFIVAVIVTAPLKGNTQGNSASRSRLSSRSRQQRSLQMRWRA